MALFSSCDFQLQEGSRNETSPAVSGRLSVVLYLFSELVFYDLLFIQLLFISLIYLFINSWTFYFVIPGLYEASLS